MCYSVCKGIVLIRDIIFYYSIIVENIDDDADVAGIPIVKLEDKQLAKTVGVFALPAIVFFRSINGTVHHIT